MADIIEFVQVRTRRQNHMETKKISDQIMGRHTINPENPENSEQKYPLDSPMTIYKTNFDRGENVDNYAEPISVGTFDECVDMMTTLSNYIVQVTGTDRDGKPRNYETFAVLTNKLNDPDKDIGFAIGVKPPSYSKNMSLSKEFGKYLIVSQRNVGRDPTIQVLTAPLALYLILRYVGNNYDTLDDNLAKLIYCIDITPASGRIRYWLSSKTTHDDMNMLRNYILQDHKDSCDSYGIKYPISVFEKEWVGDDLRSNKII